MAQDIRVVALVQAKAGQEDAVSRAALDCVGPSRDESANRLYTFMQTPHFRKCVSTVEGKLARPMQVHVLEEVS